MVFHVTGSAFDANGVYVYKAKRLNEMVNCARPETRSLFEPDRKPARSWSMTGSAFDAKGVYGY